VTEKTQDIWARWVLERQFGGDPEKQKAGLASMEGARVFRDGVLAHAAVREGDVVLDVGCGSGLIGFGALPLVDEAGAVIFCDVSQDLLDHCRTLAAEQGALDRCRFVRASATDLSELPDESVDVVTTRSVLIFVEDKARAFGEFRRVLKPGGRVSVFEPINRYFFRWDGASGPVRFFGHDAGSVADAAIKVRAYFERLQPPDSDPMMDFDERDLLRLAERTGFGEVHLELRVNIEPTKPQSWDEILRGAGNPKIPSFGEVLREALSGEEQELFAAHYRPLVEGGGGVHRMAHAYLWATRS
jgi:arsenite methyltransferase